MLVGYKNGAPANGTGVRLRKHVQQESLMNVPFTQGVAPGFQKWTNGGGAVTLEQGNLPGVEPQKNVAAFHARGFYQIIKRKGVSQGGVARRFLGLTAGHTYRVTARLNTFQAQEGKWNFSFHAAHNSASGENLTAAQMAGAEALPDGKKGPAAGQIARYDSATNTHGKWVEHSSEKSGADITLPADGVNSLTVWFRHEGNDEAETEAGLDAVAIEDLGKRQAAK